MAKKITGYIKLQVPAGAANPSPPIGPALGQRGLNIMEFCKQFNAQTQKLEKGSPIPVVITVYADRSFTFEMKTPPVSFFLKKAANIQAGAKASHGKRVLKAREGISREKLYSLDEAVQMVKDRAKAKFDETVEIAMNL